MLIGVSIIGSVVLPIIMPIVLPTVVPVALPVVEPVSEPVGGPVIERGTEPIRASVVDPVTVPATESPVSIWNSGPAIALGRWAHRSPSIIDCSIHCCIQISDTKAHASRTHRPVSIHWEANITGTRAHHAVGAIHAVCTVSAASIAHW